MTNARDIGRLRLTAQHLVGGRLATAADAVRHLLALQGQDYRGAITSVALRTAARDRDSVEAALTAGEVVRSWPMRGTLHLIAAVDLLWLLELTSERVLARAAARQAEFGLTPATLEVVREATSSIFSDDQALSRKELQSAWNDRGIETTGQRGYHLIWNLAMHGELCFGPVRDGEQLIVRTEDWIRSRRRPERDEALGELTLRYFRGHGPATVADLKRWAGLVAADVRTGVAMARPQLESLTVGDVEYLLDPEVPDRLASCRAKAKGVLLLPGFDEYLLGYGDRTAVLPSEHANAIVPGGNGMFRATVVSDGQVVGTWRETGRGTKRVLETTAFTTLDDRVAASIPRAYGALP